MRGIGVRNLGSEGPELTVLGCGTWAVGGPYEFGWGPTDDGESIAGIRHSIESGISWVDTAAVYGRGHSEEVVGQAVKPWTVGEEVYVFTKCGRNFYDGSPTISSDLRPETIRTECEESLRRLDIDRVDLYQFHWPDPDTGTPIEESWGTMVELIDAGKVRWAGVSNFDVDLLERCESIRHVDSIQPPLNLIDRSARTEIIPWAREHGTGVIVYGPMASGLLTGKYGTDLAGMAPDDWRRRSRTFTEPQLSRNLKMVEELRQVATRLGTTLAALAVAWTLTVPGVTGAIVGARRPDQVDDWLEAAHLPLSAEDLEELEAIASRVESEDG